MCRVSGPLYDIYMKCMYDLIYYDEGFQGLMYNVSRVKDDDFIRKGRQVVSNVVI